MTDQPGCGAVKERVESGDVRGRMSFEYDNVESVKLWGFQGTDPADDHHHIRVVVADGCAQDVRVSKDDFERVESMLDAHGGRP